jgi:hypothetical protein
MSEYENRSSASGPTTTRNSGSSTTRNSGSGLSTTPPSTSSLAAMFGRAKKSDSSMTLRKGPKISFAPGTAPPKEARVALSISGHETSIGGVKFYLVDVWQSGFCWLVKKRYSDFTSLHARVETELAKYNYELPHLPKKRWFEAKRWLNK